MDTIIPTDRDVARITAAIIEPKQDEEYLPLLHFLGNPTVGRMQAMWNLAKTMELLEIKTTGELFNLMRTSHDTTHRTGLHAPATKSMMEGFLSRVFYADEFKPLLRDKHLCEYLEWFSESNSLWIIERTRISAEAYRSRQYWRLVARPKHQRLVEYWPFLHSEEASDHLELLAVDAVVPKEIPEQWRQDMCQDLLVAVLSGEVSLDNLKDRAHEYIRRVWRQHPYKYGPLSLDAPPPWRSDRTLGELISAPTD